MTTDPRRAADALGELENGRYAGLYSRVADLLELRLEKHDGSPGLPLTYRLWRDPQSTSPFTDYAVQAEHIYYFLYGMAVGIQGDWAP